MRLPLAVLLAAVLAAGPADGAQKPHITDPSGDAFPAAGAGADIVAVTFSTTGRVARKAYTPTALVVTLAYAGDPATAGHVARVVDFEAAGCRVHLEAFAGGTWGDAACVGQDFDFAVVAAGKTVTFTLPFATAPALRLRKGVTLARLRAYTAFAEPFFGYELVELADGNAAAAADDAVSAATYTIR